MHIVTLSINSIVVDPEIQSRVKLDEECVQEYAEEIKVGKPFPPVTVFSDGTRYWLADGFHRLRAHELVGLHSIRAEVNTGTKRDAIFYAAGCNASHGLRRTNEDKRRAVLMLMLDEDWGKWSDNKIAKVCRVTQPFVSGIRKELRNNGYNFEMEREDLKDPDKRSMSYMLAITKRLKSKIRPEAEKDHNQIFDHSPYDLDAMDELEEKICKLENELKAISEKMKRKKSLLITYRAERSLLIGSAA